VCRDAFPKNLIPETKRLAQKAMSLKMNEVISSFQVVARVLGCIPVLETKERTSSGGQTSRWAVYQDSNDVRP
jgi:hypothetical protein